MSFKVNDSETQCQNIGQLHNPLNCEYNEIKSSNSIDIPFELLVCLTYFDEMKRIIITDFNDRSFKVLDLNGNYLGSYNPDSVLEKPGPICVSNIAKEIYIQDHIFEKVFVFDTNFKYLREFGDERCQTPFGSCIDEVVCRIYLSSYLSNLVTIWNTKTGDYISELEVFSPTFISIFRSKLIIMSATETELFTQTNIETIIENENSIFIYNKFNYQLINKLKISNCIHPKGLYIDDNMNIYFTAYDIGINSEFKEPYIPNGTWRSRNLTNDNRLIINDVMRNTFVNNNHDRNGNDEVGNHVPLSTSSGIGERTRCLYKISENGDLLQKTSLSLSGIFSMVVIDKKMFAIRGYRTPPVYMIEFQ
jgi:hypothetical protein